MPVDDAIGHFLHQVQRLPTGRLGAPSEVARVVTFLLSQIPLGVLVIGWASAAGDRPTMFWKLSCTFEACGAVRQKVTVRSGFTVGPAHVVGAAAVGAFGVSAKTAAGVPAEHSTALAPKQEDKASNRNTHGLVSSGAKWGSSTYMPVATVA
jgi:hypothetical protein